MSENSQIEEQLIPLEEKLKSYNTLQSLDLRKQLIDEVDSAFKALVEKYPEIQNYQSYKKQYEKLAEHQSDYEYKVKQVEY